VKIAALSAATGISVATLKYYLREGLLHPGVATAVNQASYDDSHVRRVRLVRSLVELGRLSIADVAEVLAQVDDESVGIHDAFGRVQDAIARDGAPPASADRLATALRLVDEFVERNDLRVREEAGARVMLAGALVHLAEFGLADLDSSDPAVLEGGRAQFDALASFFKTMAALEIASVPDADRASQVEFTVVGTVAIEVAMNAIRRLALEDASERRFAPQPVRTGRTRRTGRPG
jgi:DNA-binding transcriptional MerR regulator